MKTLIINGSPRVNGDTAGLLGILKERLVGECWVLDAYRSDISPCVDCRYCKDHSGCAVRDGMGEVCQYIQACDNVVIASPLYFSEVTGRVLDIGSRLQTYFCAKYFRGETPIEKEKRGAVILVGGGDGAPDKAYGTARTLLKLMNCREIHELVCSHGTDKRPAVEDARAVEGVKHIAAFLNRKSDL